MKIGTLDVMTFELANKFNSSTSFAQYMPVDKPETVPTFVFPVRPETPSGNP